MLMCTYGFLYIHMICLQHARNVFYPAGFSHLYKIGYTAANFTYKSGNHSSPKTCHPEHKKKKKC